MGNIKKVFVTRSDAVSDLLVEKWFDSIKDCEYTSVSTECMFTRLRLAIIQNEIEPFVLVNDGKEYTFNKDALPDTNSKGAWPFEQNIEMVHKILKVSCELRKRQRLNQYN